MSSASLSKLSSEFQLQEVLLHCSKLNLDLFEMSGEPASQSLWTVRFEIICTNAFTSVSGLSIQSSAHDSVYSGLVCKSLRLRLQGFALTLTGESGLWTSGLSTLCTHMRSSFLLHLIHDTWYWHIVIISHVVAQADEPTVKLVVPANSGTFAMYVWCILIHVSSQNGGVVYLSA